MKCRTPQALDIGKGSFNESSIDKKIRELLADDDEGMEIMESIKERLRKQNISTAKGEKGTSLGDVIKELGI